MSRRLNFNFFVVIDIGRDVDREISIQMLMKRENVVHTGLAVKKVNFLIKISLDFFLLQRNFVDSQS